MENNQLDQENKEKKAHLRIIVSVAFLMFVVILITLSCFLIKNMSNSAQSAIEFPAKDEVSKPEEDKDIEARLIDGVMVKKGKENLPPYAVMIDNHYDARPPAGIEKAQLVFEADVEGGITRLMAVFATDDEISEIGPVRSARPYYVDWAEEYSALYVHVGGSPEALVKMIDADTLHINEFYNEHYFWREQSRLAPHNVMTSSELMNSYLEKENIVEGVFLPWKFVDENKDREVLNQDISIKYRREYFNVDWKYDSENNSYIRYQADNLHKTKNGDIITAKNVVILRMASEEIDEKFRLRMENIGEGEAIVCHEGNCETGVWRKLSESTRMRFYNEDNAEISLLRGNIWIQIVDLDYEVEY